MLVDFDGTISIEDSTDALLTRYAEPAWLEVEAAWLRGEIGSRHCLAEQVALLRASPRSVQRFAAAIAIDAGFLDFLSTCRALGLPVTVLSDGFDILVHGALGSAGIALPVIANRLVHAGGDRWTAGFPHASEVCRAGSGNCKCATLAAPAAITAPGTLLVGDGRSDFCAAGAAEMVLAKGRLIRHCRDEGITHHPFADFAEIAAALPDILAGRESHRALLTRMPECEARP